MMTVRLIAHTPEPEKVVAAAAKLCYSDAHITDLLDGLDEEKTARFLTMLSDLGHASPIEHASFTFGIEGVSRTLLAQITRHRIASFSVQSQRYVRLDDFRYVIPPEIEAIPEAKAAFIESMNEDARRYLDLVQKLEDGHTARLMAEGLPEKQARAKASKQANEDARFVLPNACETKMVVTMNARSLQNFFHLRCCSRAQTALGQMGGQQLCLGGLAGAVQPFDDKKPALAHSAFSPFSAAYWARTSVVRPQHILPSGQGPHRQTGPALAKIWGATGYTSVNIFSASSRISHWARLQQRSWKKFIRLRAFMVTTILVSQALGNTKRASSLACLEALARACFSGIPSAIRRAVCPSSSLWARSR